MADPRIENLDWLADRLHLHPETLRRRARQGALTPFGVFKVAGAWRVNVAVFEQAIGSKAA